jgi:hypothetical protein
MLRNLFSLLMVIIGSVSFTYGQELSTFQLTDLREKIQQSYLKLLKAEKFSIGLTGYVGTRSGEENALHRLLKSKKAIRSLESLVDKASPEGKLYALLGLRLKDKSAYQKALLRLKSNYEPPERSSFWGIKSIDSNGNIAADNIDKGLVPKGIVVTDMGDLIQMKNWNEVIQSIENGNYDKLLKKH